MDWIKERSILEVMKTPPPINSNLKKKMSIINRLKNIQNEDFSFIIAELKSENLQKFYVEIINSLLSNSKITAHTEIHKIVKIFYLYSGESVFINHLTQALKKLYEINWFYSSLFAEAYFMINRSAITIIKPLIKSCKEGRLELLHYLSCNFEGVEASLFEKYLTDETKNINSKNIEMIREIYLKLGINKQLSLPSAYSDLIKYDPEEFSFYTEETTPSDSKFTRDELKKLENECSNIGFLDKLSRGIDNNYELILKIYKKKKKLRLVPAIARIISRLRTHRIKILQMVKASDLENLDQSMLLLVCELYKFTCISTEEISLYINYIIRNKMASFICLAVESLGRFMIVRRESCDYILKILEKARSISLCEDERLMVNNSISGIFRSTPSKNNILSYLSGAIKDPNFKNSQIFQLIRASERLLAIIFIQIDIYDDLNALANLIVESKMKDMMIGVYIDSLEHFYKKSKHLTFKTVEILNLLLESSSKKEQTAVIRNIKNLNLGGKLKCLILLDILEYVDSSLHRENLEYIVDTDKSTSVRNRVFNFCEKHDLELGSHDVQDSFEREMEYLSLIDS